MQLSVERLRWGLVAAALLLIAVLVAMVGYGRYRAVKAWRQIVARSGATVTHEAHEVTYSQAVGGRTVFTIHAADAMPHGDGRYTLHNVELLLYGRDGSQADRIYGSEFDYDQKNEVARALGEVHMDLQAPAALSVSRHEEDAAKPHAAGGMGKLAETPQTMHVRTSGLVYMRKLGVAATSQEVEIAYEGFQGNAKGAEFDAAQSTVHLLADVRVDGRVRGEAAHLTAAKADLERDSDVIRLVQPRVQSGSGAAAREASAAAAELHLGKDGSLEAVDARGDVTMRSGTQTVRAGALQAVMNDRSLLQRAELTGGVQMDDRAAARPMHGAARQVTVICDSDGAARTIVARGAVSLREQERATGGVPSLRQMAADRITMTMRRGQDGRSEQLATMEATGGANVQAESAGSGQARRGPGQVKTTELAGDELRLTFAAQTVGRDRPEMLTAHGHTRLEQRAADGGSENSVGDSLVAHFADTAEAGETARGGVSGLQVLSAQQTGHVQLHSQPAGTKSATEATEATAERTVFDGVADRVTLTGPAMIRRGQTNLSAATITLWQQTGDASAEGDVSGTFAGGGRVTHVVAQEGVLRRAEQTAEFRGTDIKPARMWQGPSQLAAASLLLDRAHDRLRARPGDAGGLVHAVFANGPAESTVSAERGRTAGPSILRVASPRLDYTGALHQAVFTGGVRAEAATGNVQGSRAVVFLNSGGSKAASESAAAATAVDPLGGSVEKIVVSGDVRLQQPGRTATAEQLLYTAAKREFVLTGAPGHLPRVTDEKQGSISGATLLFGAADSNIVVAGEPGGHGQARGRVHTEMVVKP